MATPTGSPYLTAVKVGSPNVAITNIQRFNLFRGKRKVSDLWSAGTARITGRRPDLLPALLIGDEVELTINIPKGTPTPDSVTFAYRVADVTIEYGTTAALDTWIIDLEDVIAYLGRASLPTRVIADGTNTATAATTIASDVGLTLTTVGTASTTTSGQTVTGQNALEVFQILVNTEYAWLYVGTDITFVARNSWLNQPFDMTFADDGTGDLKYTELEFASLADNYADTITVRPRGSSDVITGTGIFSYNLDSFSVSTGEATNLAYFLDGILDVLTARPSAVTYLLNGQDTVQAIGGLVADAAPVDVIFRGTTYNARRIGVGISGDPESTSATIYLMPSEATRFMILDNATYGKLDNNRLGW